MSDREDRRTRWDDPKKKVERQKKAAKKIVDKAIDKAAISALNGHHLHTYTNGSKYVGEWKDGKRHGQGTLTHANGDIQSGYFSKGKFKNDLLIEKIKKSLKQAFTPERLFGANSKLASIFGGGSRVDNRVAERKAKQELADEDEHPKA